VPECDESMKCDWCEKKEVTRFIHVKFDRGDEPKAWFLAVCQSCAQPTSNLYDNMRCIGGKEVEIIPEKTFHTRREQFEEECEVYRVMHS